MSLNRARQHQSQGPQGLVALLLSLLMHVILFALLAPTLSEATTVDRQKLALRSKPPKKLVLRTVIEPTKPKPRELADKTKPEEREKEKEKEKEKEEEKDEELEDIEIDRKIVAQKNNDENPSEADYLSDQANKTEEQTRARETTKVEAMPGDTVPEDIKETTSPDPSPTPEEIDQGDEGKDPSKTLAMATPESVQNKTPQKEQPSQDEVPAPERPQNPEQPNPDKRGEKPTPDARRPVPHSPVIRKNSRKPQSKQERVDRSKIFKPSLNDFEEVFGKPSEEAVRKAGQKKRKKLFAKWAERERALRASLENMITEIQPGNHTSVNAKRAVYARYIGSIHRKIHKRWANEYLMFLDRHVPDSDPLSNPRLSVELEIIIRAKDGKVIDINIVRSSGELRFDAEAISVHYAVGPHPNPPGQIVSPNGKIYLHWQHWRDGRQCGVFGVAIYKLNKEGRKEKRSAPKKG